MTGDTNAHRHGLDAGRLPTDPIRILSMDGGGMRGVISARILVELERLSGRPIAGLFDVIAGTSTGGMIALGVSAPGPDGKPALSAERVLDTYLKRGRQIFPRAEFRPIEWERLRASRPIVAQRIGALARPTRYGNARYSRMGLSLLLNEMFGTTPLSKAMADVIVPSYDWRAGRSFVFRSRKAREGDMLDPTMVQVALATTAAPTYFPAFQLRSTDREYVFIDGGLAANNPTSVAYYEALYQAGKQHREDPQFLVVSIGTGTLPEAPPTYQELWSRNWLRMGMGMLGVMFDGTSEIVDELLTEIIKPKEPGSRYWRLNPELRGVRLNLDDASPGQLDRLVGLADRLIADHVTDLQDMVARLTASGSTNRSGATESESATAPKPKPRTSRSRPAKKPSATDA